MKANWPEVIVKDVCDLVVDCVNKTAPVLDYSSPYKMIRTTNVRYGVVSLENARSVSKETYEKWTRRSVPKFGDIILTREAPLGEVGMLKSNEKVFLGQRTMQYRANPEKLDSHFLLYALQESFMQGQIRASGSGSTVEHMRVGDAENLKIKLPHMDVQQKIGANLSAYDDLIENNNRRIAILEEMAHSLYKEWFVKFRFPGHEEVKMVDSELGQMPEGWKIHKVNDLFSLNIGKTPPRNEAQWFTYNQGLQWVSIRDMGNNQIFLLSTAENLTDSAIEKFNFRIVPSDTIIMSFKLTVGKVSITTEDMVTNEAIAHFNIKNNAILCKEYVYFYLQNFMFQTLGNTSSIGNAINSQVVKSMPFLLPDQHLIKKYERYITPHFKQILKLLKSNQNLKTQRDMLLPKLISGKIAVNQEII